MLGSRVPGAFSGRRGHGPLWVAAGLAGMAGAIAGGYAAALLLFIPLALASVIPVIYSYLLYKRLQS